ncbi:MAG TPA: sugar transferase [Planctomycetota bacterium]|nr:sugar transferase [Planctomycetota bacterium]
MAEPAPDARPKIQAILLATSASQAFGTIVEHAPVELMPLANQPFIGRVVGWLVGLGVKEIVVLASHRVDLFSNFLGDGSRWGCRVKVVAVASEAHAFARLPELFTADCALVGSASTLPRVDDAALQSAFANGGGARFTAAGGARLNWSAIKREACGEAVRECKSMDDFEKHLAACRIPEFETPAPALSADSPAALLQSSHAILDGARPEQLIPGASAEKGVYISHSVVIHPTVRVTPPVIIGADCHLDRGAEIGPYAVIGERTILGAHTTLEDAVVFPGTYIGPHLELAHVVVDHRSLAFRDAKGSVPVPDQFLLSASEDIGVGRALRNFFRRLFAILFLLLLSVPILLTYLLGLVMGARRPLRRIEAVSLPAAADPALWQTFHYYEFDTTRRGAWEWLVTALRLRRLPTLWNVVRGEAAWIGLRPLTPAEMSALPTDWRQLYASGKIGIVRLAELDQIHAGENSDDQIYSSEAYYVATDSVRTDLRIFWRAIWKR